MWLGKYVIRYISNSIIRERCNSYLFQPSEGYGDEWFEEGDDCLTILPVGDVVVRDVRV